MGLNECLKNHLFNDHLTSKILLNGYITYKMLSSNDIFEIY